MAPHGRPKLKRPPRVGLQDLSKSTGNALLTMPESASRRRSTAEMPSEPRVKTPPPDLGSTPMTSESPKAKSPASEDRASPEPNCAICLGKLRNKSFTDSCLHQFCFKCLVQWSKVKPECPLCKQGFKSIIHNVRSNEDYDQYHCRPPPSARDSLINELLSLTPGFSRFRYRTTQVSGSRRSETTIHELLLQHQNMPYVIPPSAPRWSSSRMTRRQIVTAEFRANVYNQDLWVQDQPDITGRYRECSPEFYRVNPAQVHRLVPWLNREVPSVSQSNSTHAQVIIDLILSLITQHHIQSRVMYSRLRPFFGIRTSHFLHEFNAFARSPYDMIGFDQASAYGPNPNPTVFTPDADLPTNFTDSDSSDVIILDSDVEPVAGPSGIRRRPVSVIVAVQPTNSQSTTTSTQEAPLLLDDSDDCEIVDYVKPRHERTPEIIVLSDSEEEAANSEIRGGNEDDNFWNRLQQVNESLNAISNILTPSTPLPARPYLISSSSSVSSSYSSSLYTPYTLRSTSKKSPAKKSQKTRRKSSRTASKSSNKPAKMRAQAIFSDSEEESDIPRRSSKSKRHTKSKVRNRRATRLPSSSSSSSSGSERTDLPGTSGLRRNSFSSHDSLRGRSNSFFLEEDNVPSNSDSDFKTEDMTERFWPMHSSPEHFDYRSEDVERKPNITSSYTTPVGPVPSPLPYDHEQSSSLTQGRPDLVEPKLETWCIKPSNSNHEETSDDDSSQCSSSSEFRPKLKSIVIMRTNNSNNYTPNKSGSPVSGNESFRRRSHSPVASTSRTELQSSTTSLSSRACSQSPSRHSSKSSALSSARVSRYACKRSRREREDRRSRTRSRSDSSSSWERTVKKPRASKWQFNESSEDSAY